MKERADYRSPSSGPGRHPRRNILFRRVLGTVTIHDDELAHDGGWFNGKGAIGDVAAMQLPP